VPRLACCWRDSRGHPLADRYLLGVQRTALDTSEISEFPNSGLDLAIGLEGWTRQAGLRHPACPSPPSQT
jgi:hypothetical protein